MNVYQKLNLAREKFHSLEIKKSGRNNFAGYSYFEIGDFVVPALKIFNELGLTSVIRFENDLATMEIVNNEKPEDRTSVTSPMSEAALKGCHPVQNLGAVETYIRRYLWVIALEIVEHDAVDASEPVKDTKSVVKNFAAEAKIRACKTPQELAAAWVALSPEDRKAVAHIKDELKEKLA